MSSLKHNDEGFTGLEAAIVLIAFVVVAAVFSYVSAWHRVLHDAEGTADRPHQCSGDHISSGTSGPVSVMAGNTAGTAQRLPMLLLSPAFAAENTLGLICPR